MDSKRSDPEVAPQSDQHDTGAAQASKPPARRKPSASGRRPRKSGAAASAAAGVDGLAAIYDQLLAISRGAFANGHEAVAYHALAAALHAARDLEDNERLEEIEVTAHKQMKAIDTNTPASPLSTAAAAYRGMVPLWESLARQAETARHLAYIAKKRIWSY
jgi:hypothetical protein